MTETSRQVSFVTIGRVALGLALLAALGCGHGPTTPIIGPAADSVALSPDTLVLRVGQSGSFTVVGYDSAGAILNGFRTTWTSNDTAHAVIGVSGARITAIAEGSAKVFVQSGSARDSGVVVVLPVQTGWFVQPSNANGATLNSLFFQPDGRNGWVVGSNGKILSTTDAGDHWSAQNSGSSFNLNGVWFPSVSEGWVVGTGATVLFTSDRGAHWDRITNTGASENLMDVFFADTSRGWIVGSSGLIMRTRDRGRTWERQHPTTFTLNGIAFADTAHGWAVGENGVIVETEDGGRNWVVVAPAITAQALKAVWQRSPTQAWAAGDLGVVAYTVAVPSDTSWILGNVGAQNQLEGIHFVTGLVGYAVGWNGSGAVLRSDNGGLTWASQVSNTQFRMNDVFFVDENRGWAVGASGTVIHTGTGGNP